MNEKIETQALANINELLAYIKSGVQTAENFVIEQTPLLVQEILTFNFIESLLWSIFQFFVFSIFIYFLFVKKFDVNEAKQKVYIACFGEWSCKTEGFSPFLFCIIAVVSSIFLLKSIFNIINAIKIQVAPRLYLIEYVSDLVK